MSTLWTPDGERPVGGDDPTPGGAPHAGGDAGTGPAPAPDPALDEAVAALLPDDVDPASLTPEQRARAEQLVREMSEARERLLATPAATIVANHAMGLYELAALHLAAPRPDFSAATLAIDALRALTEALEGRLGEAEPTVRQALTQLQLAYVEVKRAHAAGDDS